MQVNDRSGGNPAPPRNSTLRTDTPSAPSPHTPLHPWPSNLHSKRAATSHAPWPHSTPGPANLHSKRATTSHAPWPHPTPGPAKLHSKRAATSPVPRPTPPRHNTPPQQESYPCCEQGCPGNAAHHNASHSPGGQALAARGRGGRRGREGQRRVGQQRYDAAVHAPA